MKNMQRRRDNSTFIFTNADKSTERDAKIAELRIFMIDFSRHSSIMIFIKSLMRGIVGWWVDKKA